MSDRVNEVFNALARDYTAIKESHERLLTSLKALLEISDMHDLRERTGPEDWEEAEAAIKEGEALP